MPLVRCNDQRCAALLLVEPVDTAALFGFEQLAQLLARRRVRERIGQRTKLWQVGGQPYEWSSSSRSSWP